MDFCGSATDSWFYTGAHHSIPQPLRNDSQGDIPIHDQWPQTKGEDWKKWNLQVLEALQEFSRRYQPIHGYVCVVLCTFGLLTNILNFIVLTRPNMRTSINVILAAVALCDAGTMCSYLIYVVHFYVVNHGRCLTEIYTYNWMVFILFHSLWSILLHSSSIWLAVLLAFMRLTVMKKAKLSHASLRPSHVWRPMSFIYAPLAILCIPVIFTHSVVEIELEPCPNIAGNGSMDPMNSLASGAGAGAGAGAGVVSASAVGYTVLPSVSALAKNCLLLRAVLLINGLIFKLLPCLLLVFSIFRLLKTLDAAKKHNHRMHRRRNDGGRTANPGCSKYFSSRTTKMLLVVLSIFLVTELPQAFIATMSGFYPNDVYFKIYPTLGDLLDLLSLLNSGVNFVLYCGMSSRFRTTFMDLFAPRALHRRLNCQRPHLSSLSDNENATTGGGPSVSGVRQGLISTSSVFPSVPSSAVSRSHRVPSGQESKYSSCDVSKTDPSCATQAKSGRMIDMAIKSEENCLFLH